MQEEQINLVDEVIKAFRDNGFSEEEIAYIESLPTIQYAYKLPLYEQMSALCSLFYQLVYYNCPSAPVGLRYYMVIENDPVLWMDGIKINVIPYIREKKILERMIDVQERINSEQNSTTIQ
jgi:hypothetical protein